MRKATLCLLIRQEHPPAILLGLKKTGFGQGKVVGFGGKIEDGETVVQAAARELEEETGLHVAEADLERMARLTFLFPARPDWDHLVHVFLARTWQGTPRESREVRPAWYPLNQIPLGDMWADASYWLPPVLAGQRIRATFIFNSDNETVDRADLEITPAPASRPKES